MSPRNCPKSGRRVALGYIRNSHTRNPHDMDSPDRQRANIEAVAARKGYTVEWYMDASGHKSGRQEKNRPGWLALKTRIGDPDVAAVIANDLSRLHRKLARMSDLLDTCEEHKTELVLAAPGRDLDTSTAMGRTVAQFIALQDEAYAADISARSLDTAAYRRTQGKVNGRVPFGTMRDGEGYLMPDVKGAWTLPDGRWVTGTRDNPPRSAVDFRSYYRCARRMLILYAAGNIGYDKIAYQLNQSGWLFNDRKGIPRLITGDDVRRVVANWPEFGGAIVEAPLARTHSKDRSTRMGTGGVHFNPARAVMPIRLLVRVANVLKVRSVDAPDQGVTCTALIYALTRITCCAHCERLAAKQNNPRLRTTLTGSSQYGTLRYRHKGGVACGCTKRSIPLEEYEREFRRLLALLTISESELISLTERTIQRQRKQTNLPDETKKNKAIALCRRRIDAALHLYGDGRLSRADYVERVDTNERQLAHWEAYTTDTQKAANEVTRVANALHQLVKAWDSGDEQEKQNLVRSLFTSITYDLDTRRIVDFKLTPWADRVLAFKEELSSMEAPGEELVDVGANHRADGYLERPVCQSTAKVRYCDTPRTKALTVVSRLYDRMPATTFPVSRATPVKTARNNDLRSRHQAGESIPMLARAFGISNARVHQILHHRRR